MAREILTSAFAIMRSSLLTACALVAFCAAVDAQTRDRQQCVTRYEDGKPYIFCEDNKVLAPNEMNEMSAPRPRSLSPPPAQALPPPPPDPPAATPRTRSTISGSGSQPAAGGRSPAALNGGAPPTAAKVAKLAKLRPVRALIEPAEMPPRGVAGYGVVAFTTRPLPQDVERYKFVCEAYKATLISQNELPANTPLIEQMITYWPITNKSTPEAQRADCPHLVANYALEPALAAIQDADKLKEGLASRRGPFLIAWAPSESRFTPDALVLVMDLLSLDSQRSFVEVLQDWRQKIVDNPQLWQRGFDAAALRRTIRDTFDRYGDGLVRLIKGG